MANIVDLTKASSKDHPQAVVSRFWANFNHKAPGKVTSVFPRELYKDLNSDVSPSPATRGPVHVAQSYAAARSVCLDLIRDAVAHCEATNAKFCDPEYDIESDFFYQENNCLLGIERCECQKKPSVPTPAAEDNDKDKKCACASQPKPKSVHRVSWIFDNPQFTINGFSDSDIKQGVLGDCWWLTGVGNIAHRKDLMNKICVGRDEECGIYGYVFHKDGEWVPTIIDDNLYMHATDYGSVSESYDASGKKTRLYKKRYQTGSDALFFARCENQNETWLPLLEKAYAKVHGDYKAIEGGLSGTAVEDLTGGVTSMILANRILRKEKLWKELIGIEEEDAEFVFGLSAYSDSGMPGKNGIALNHAYAVIRAVEVEDQKSGTKTKLLKIRNPWGESASPGLGEWRGPWSDGSKEWTHEMIQRLEHEFGDDGVFWMTLDDALNNFKWLHRTRLFDDRWTVSQQWTSTRVSWLPGYTKKKFIVETNEDGIAVIVLSKLDDRYFKGLEGPYYLNLEFIVREVGSPTKLAEVRTSSSNPDSRSVNYELRLKPGKYEVLPRILAESAEEKQPVEEVFKKYATSNPKKLQQIGFNYDTAHAKVGVLDEDEAYAKKKEVEKEKLKELAKKDEVVSEMKKSMEKMQTAMAEMQLELNKKKGGSQIKGEKGVESDPAGDEEGLLAASKLVQTAAVGTSEEPTPDSKDGEKGEDKKDDGAGEENPDEGGKGQGEEQPDASAAAGGDDAGEASTDVPWNPVCVMCLSVYTQHKGVSVRIAGDDE